MLWVFKDSPAFFDSLYHATPYMYTIDTGRRARCFAYAADHGHEWPGKPSPDQWRQGADGGADVRRATTTNRDDDASPSWRSATTSVLRGHRSVVGRWRQSPSRPIRAVDGVSLRLARGRIMGIVGESGSGKTTLGETVVRLLRPTTGSVMFSGTDTASLDRSQSSAFRRRVQMIFQDPYSSLSRG